MFKALMGLGTSSSMQQDFCVPLMSFYLSGTMEKGKQLMKGDFVLKDARRPTKTMSSSHVISIQQP